MDNEKIEATEVEVTDLTTGETTDLTDFYYGETESDEPSGLAAALLIGGCTLGGILLDRYVVIPVTRKAKSAWATFKEKREEKKEQKALKKESKKNKADVVDIQSPETANKDKKDKKSGGEA